MDNNKKHYKTASLALACAISIKITLIDVDKTNPRRALFIFEDSQELTDLVSAYWEGNLRVDPQTYFSQLRVLKARLYDNG